jgi:hypothetical protein
MSNGSHIGRLDIGLPLSVQGVSSHEGSVVLRRQALYEGKMYIRLGTL